MERLPWVIGVGPCRCNDKCHFERGKGRPQRRGDDGDGGQSDVLGDGGGVTSQEYRWAPDAGKGRRWILPWEPPEGTRPADTFSQ